MTPTAQIISAAQDLGFARIGFSPVGPLPRGAKALDDWLDAGHHADMDYMAKHGTRDNPQKVLEQAKSLIVVALPYPYQETEAPTGKGTGFVARYARGTDYHIVLRQKLEVLANRCTEILGRSVLARPCVDTAPLLERELAHQSGLGFIAKSTMLLIPGVGTYVLLGELLVDVELAPTESIEPKCGTCTSCLDACPTGAFVSPYVLDARKCISYLTIEHAGTIPQQYRQAMGNMVFGCDICQEVCPSNASTQPRPSASELKALPHLEAPDLIELLTMTSSGYRRFVRGTALRRASRQQLARNAAVALGNSGDPRAVEPLCNTLNTNRYPLVREHAAWALGQLGGDDAHAALSAAGQNDTDPSVRQEAQRALKAMAG